jgi:hypothetical protein
MDISSSHQACGPNDRNLEHRIVTAISSIESSSWREVDQVHLRARIDESISPGEQADDGGPRQVWVGAWNTEVDMLRKKYLLQEKHVSSGLQALIHFGRRHKHGACGLSLNVARGSTTACVVCVYLCAVG